MVYHRGDQQRDAQSLVAMNITTMPLKPLISIDEKHINHHSILWISQKHRRGDGLVRRHADGQNRGVSHARKRAEVTVRAPLGPRFAHAGFCRWQKCRADERKFSI